jgi:hypothetical protein
MYRFFKATTVSLVAAGCAFTVCHAQSLPSIRQVHVLHTPGQVEIEIEASDRIVPQANLLKGPDRLLIDFVNARPGPELRNQAVDRPEVKSVRVGLFSSNPPVTRIVLDLNGAQPYQVFPSGRTIIVKVGRSNTQTANSRSNPEPQLRNANFSPQMAGVTNSAPAAASAPAPKPLEVSFHDGLLSISATKANLSEVLFAVHQRTGADIAIPAGAEQEQVIADLGPAPAPEVLAQLLNGTKFNFLILSSASNPADLDRVILTMRPEGPMPPPSRPLEPALAIEDEEASAPVTKTLPAHSGPPVHPGAVDDNPDPAAATEMKAPDNGDNPQLN